MLNQLLISFPMQICLFWGIFFLIRSLNRPSEPRIVWTLVLFYAVGTVLYLNHWLYFSNMRSTIGAYTYLLANLSVYPIYYTYLRTLTRTRSVVEQLCLFIPTVLCAILFPLNAWFGWQNEQTLILFSRCCFAAQVVWVWIRGYLLLRATRRRMDDTYSDERSYLLQPTYVLQHLLGITAFISSVLNIVGRDFFVREAPVAVPAVVMSVLLFGLGYVAAHTSLPQDTVALEEETEHKEEATTEETDALMFRIADALREQKLYADPRLTIQDLATAVNSNRTYVSNCINRCTGFSFSQYVTRYRVENAQRVLCDPQYENDHDAVAAAIALSGFTSDQNFYRVFKDATGMTPLQYRNGKNEKK